MYFTLLVFGILFSVHIHNKPNTLSIYGKECMHTEIPGEIWGDVVFAVQRRRSAGSGILPISGGDRIFFVRLHRS